MSQAETFVTLASDKVIKAFEIPTAGPGMTFPYSFPSLTLLVTLPTSVNLWEFVLQCAPFHWAESVKGLYVFNLFHMEMNE